MQLHYNVLNGGVTPDQTSVEFYTTTEPPEMELRATAQAYVGIDIPAGDANSVQVTTFPVNQTDLTVIGVAPHMHSIGTHIGLTSLGKMAPKNASSTFRSGISIGSRPIDSSKMTLWLRNRGTNLTHLRIR